MVLVDPPFNARLPSIGSVLLYLKVAGQEPSLLRFPPASVTVPATNMQLAPPKGPLIVLAIMVFFSVIVELPTELPPETMLATIPPSKLPARVLFITVNRAAPNAPQLRRPPPRLPEKVLLVTSTVPAPF